MMGERPTAQGALFYGFSLEQHVPAGHLVRAIDWFVDLSGIRQRLQPFYSEIGRYRTGSFRASEGKKRTLRASWLPTTFDTTETFTEGSDALESGHLERWCFGSIAPIRLVGTPPDDPVSCRLCSFKWIAAD